MQNRRSPILLKRLSGSEWRKRCCYSRKKYGLEADGATINVTLSRDDIASLVGTVTETAIRLLAYYKHTKVVDLVGKKIKILDMNALVRSANIQY